MDFEKHIVEFLQSKNYDDWDVLSILQYLSDNVDFTSENVKDISDILKKQLEILSNNANILKAAKNKAIRIINTLQITLTRRPEILKFLEDRDKFAQTLNKNVERDDDKDQDHFNLRIGGTDYDENVERDDDEDQDHFNLQTGNTDYDENVERDDDKDQDHFNLQTGNTDYDKLSDGEKSPVGRSLSASETEFTKIDTREQILHAAKDSLASDEIKYFKKFIPVFKEFKEKQKTNIYSCTNDDVMDIRGNSEFANYLSVEQYAELLSVKPKRDVNIPVSWRRIIEDYYMDLINDKKKTIDDWICITNDLIVISEKDTEETAQIKKYLYKVMSPLIESFCKPIPAISAHNTSEHHYWSEFGHRFFSRALDDFVGLDWRVLEAPVRASKYRKNYGLDHITQSVVDGKFADILAWTESGEEIFVGEQSGPPTKWDLTKFATDSFKLYRELRDCLNVRILHAVEIGDTSYSNRMVFGVLGQLFEIKMLLMWKDGVYIYEEFGSLTIASHYNKIYTMKTGMLRLLEFILVIKNEVTKKVEAGEYNNDRIQLLRRKFREILPTHPSPIKKSKPKKD